MAAAARAEPDAAAPTGGHGQQRTEAGDGSSRAEGSDKGKGKRKGKRRSRRVVESELGNFGHGGGNAANAPPPKPSPPPTRRPRPRATGAEIAARVNDALRAPVVRVGAQPSAWATISSGFAALDAVTGLGGLPRGRVTELIGRPTSGRETIATRAAAAAGGATAWVDVTGALDVAYLAEHGVDLERLYVLRPPAGRPREALAMAERVVACGRFDLIVLDALADLPPCGETTMAVGRFVRVITPRLGAGQAALLVLSSPEHYHRPVAHAAALRLALTRVGTLRRGGVFRGWRTRATVLKSPGLQGGESGLEVWL